MPFLAQSTPPSVWLRCFKVFWWAPSPAVPSAWLPAPCFSGRVPLRRACGRCRDAQRRFFVSAPRQSSGVQTVSIGGSSGSSFCCLAQSLRRSGGGVAPAGFWILSSVWLPHASRGRWLLGFYVFHLTATFRGCSFTRCSSLIAQFPSADLWFSFEPCLHSFS